VSLRIVVSGMVAGDPAQGGATWAVLQYVLGLRRLGHHVTLIEPVPGLTRDRVAAFHHVRNRFGLTGALVERGSRNSIGLDAGALRRAYAEADVLLDISGILRGEEAAEAIPVRVYLDLDPAFNQLWAVADGIDVGLDGHTHFATVGQLIGDPSCTVPTCGLSWITTLPPVVLEHWPVAGDAPRRSFTTVGNWRSYGSIHHGGQVYGQRAHSLRRLLGIASSSTHAFEVALAIHRDERDDLDELQRHGWRLIDPAVAAATPTAYQRFVQSSLAEIGIAKSGYVVSNCGWFSDRSACYLASGRPVVAQDTGFGAVLPTGLGLLAFSDARTAVDAADDVCGRYDAHRAAARSIAEEHLDSDRVLTRLLKEVGAL
jgi:hypothetical protein